MEKSATTYLAEPVKPWRKSVFLLNASLWVTNQVLMLIVSYAFFQCTGNLIVYFTITFPFYIAVSLLCTIVALDDADVKRIKNPVIKYVGAVFFLGLCQLQQLKFLFLQYKSSRKPTFYASCYGIDALLSGIPFIFACSYCLLRDCDPSYQHPIRAERRKILCCSTFILLRTVSRGVVSVDYNICRSVFSTWSCKSVNFLVHAIWRLSEVLLRIVLYCLLALYITRRADGTSTISQWFLLPLLLDYVFTTAMLLHCWQNNIKVKLALATGTMLMVANVLQFSRVPGSPTCTTRFNRAFVTYRCTSLVWYFALFYILDVPPAAGSTTALFITRCPLCFHCVLASGATYASGLVVLPWIRASLFVQGDSAFVDKPAVLSLQSPLREPLPLASAPSRNLEPSSSESSPRLAYGTLPELLSDTAFPHSVSYEMFQAPDRTDSSSVQQSPSPWSPSPSAKPSVASCSSSSALPTSRSTYLRSAASVATMPLYPPHWASFLYHPPNNCSSTREIALVPSRPKCDSARQAPCGEAPVSTRAHRTVPQAPRAAGVTARGTTDSTPLSRSQSVHVANWRSSEEYLSRSSYTAAQVMAGPSRPTWSRTSSQHGIELSPMKSSLLPLVTSSSSESVKTWASSTSSPFSYHIPKTDRHCRNVLDDPFGATGRRKTAMPGQPP